MDFFILLFFTAFFGPPILAVRQTYLILKREKRRLQFGLIELLMLPLLTLPVTLLYLQWEIAPWALIIVVFFQFSFASLIWVVQPVNAWRPAFGLVIGSLIGLALLFTRSAFISRMLPVC